MGGPKTYDPAQDEQKPKENDPDEKATALPTEAPAAQAEEVKKPEE